MTKKKKSVIFIAMMICFGLGCLVTFVFMRKVSHQGVNRSFYDKLRLGQPVNILIVGDSIGNGDGSVEEYKWGTLLGDWLQSEYKVECNVTNVSMGGQSSYAGFGRVAALDDGKIYDLAILCYGQNDPPDNFLEKYESIIYGLRGKYGTIDMLAILESAQLEYTDKMVTIQELCAFYGIPVVDTIAAFADSGYLYDDLTKDGTHPNNLGNAIYFETIAKIINEKTGGPMGDWVYDENLTKYYSRDSFKKVNDCTLRLKCKGVSGRIGMFRAFHREENKTILKIDGEEQIVEERYWPYEFKQDQLYEIAEDVYEVKDSIEIVFDSEESLEDFRGLMITNVTMK